MLAIQRMGSYHGQDAAGLPFGYNESIEGMAFPPDYRPRGPPPAPPGKPLLNLSDQEQLNGFFAGFDSNSLASNPLPPSGPGMMTGDAMALNEQPLTPQYFISSHTHMQGQAPFVDPNALEGGDSMFNSTHMPMLTHGVPYGQMVQHTAQALPFTNYQNPQSNSNDFFDPLSASISNTFPLTWPQPLPSNNINSSGPRPLVRFGSDSRFQPTGYIPPLGSAEVNDANGMQRFEWLEGDAQSTAPNTQPSTQPSSPVWTRKRKAEVDPSRRPDTSNSQIEIPEQAEDDDEVEPDTAPTPMRKRRRVTLKTEAQSLIPSSQSQTHSPSTPTTTTTTKASTRPKRKSLPTPSPHKPSPTSTSTSTTKPKRPPAVSSSSSSGIRVPLTSDQKRANHTNSEQRRRDQAQKAFAQLFDLVPELEREGKLSQMKKLERVVRKLRELEEGNRECRRRIGVLAKGGS